MSVCFRGAELRFLSQRALGQNVPHRTLTVLVLDDLGIQKIMESERNDLLEVLEDRYGRSSTVVTSQLPIPKWHEWLADPTAADAILDRLVHNAYKLELKGASRPKEIVPRRHGKWRHERGDACERSRRAGHLHRRLWVLMRLAIAVSRTRQATRAGAQYCALAGVARGSRIGSRRNGGCRT
jgi:hypothetical protein